jgi:hypothetical protein
MSSTGKQLYDRAEQVNSTNSKAQKECVYNYLNTTVINELNSSADNGWFSKRIDIDIDTGCKINYSNLETIIKDHAKDHQLRSDVSCKRNEEKVECQVTYSWLHHYPSDSRRDL